MKEMEYSRERTVMILAQGHYRRVPYYVFSMGTHPCAYIDASWLDNDIDVNCHGGVTYDEDRLQNVWDEAFEEFRPEMSRFIGWDYAHAGDYCELLPELGGKKYTTEEIVEDIKQTIDGILGESNG